MENDKNNTFCVFCDKDKKVMKRPEYIITKKQKNDLEEKAKHIIEVFISDYKLKKTVFDLFNDNNL